MISSHKHINAKFTVVIIVVAAVTALPVLAWCQSHPDDVFWDSVFGALGANSRVLTVYIHGSEVYAGGQFTAIGGITARGIARWDGQDWYAFGDGLGGYVNKILVHDGVVYAGGSFEGGNIAWWDGTQWREMDGGLTDILYVPTVNGIVPFQGDIYVGGGFEKAGGKVVNGIARWDGTEWFDLDGGLFNYAGFGTVGAMAASDSFLYVGGAFYGSGYVAAENVAKWDGYEWSSLNSPPVRGDIRTMAVSGSNLYVGGWINFNANPGVINNIGRWNGQRWDVMGGGTNEMVLSVFAIGTDVYVAGNFTAAGGIPANRVALWDGVGWTAFGSGLDLRGWTFAVAARDDGEVFVGGDQNTAGGIASPRISRWYDPVPFPAHPFPPDKSGGQPAGAQLSWETAGPQNAPTAYNVYFGASEDPPLAASDILQAGYDPGQLDFGTTYYWKIVAKDGSGHHATGTLWRFTTEEEVTSRLVVSSALMYCGSTMGDTVTIDVSIDDNPVPIGAGGFDLSYDSSLLTFVSCERGDLTENWQYFDCADLGAVIRIGGFDTTAIPDSSFGVFARLIFLSNCCGVDSSTSTLLSAINLIDDLAPLRPVDGEFRCEVFVSDGDVNGDGYITSGDAYCVFESYLSYPEPLLNACGTDGWEVRGDVDCSGQITPGDAECIYDYWLDGSCSFCGGSPSPSSFRAVTPPVVSLRYLEFTGSAQVAVALNVSNIPSLEAFGLEIEYPAGQLGYLGIGLSELTRDFEQSGCLELEDGRLRIGGFCAEPIEVTFETKLVEIWFQVLTNQLDGSLLCKNFVDDLDGADTVSVVVGTGDARPRHLRYVLYQNHPNPFNPKTTIRYEIPDGVSGVPVKLSIYDVEGKRVCTLVNTHQDAGAYKIDWEGRDERGRKVSSGVYFYVLKAGQLQLSRKLVLLK